MKRILAFLRSMTFGMILLLLIAVCAAAGSVIPQKLAAMDYVQRYGAQAAGWIVRLGLDDVFAAPYFIALLAALCANLTGCSLVRVRRLRGSFARYGWRGIGLYGTFLTHLAIILLLVAGASALYGARLEDRTVMPGETLTLADGTCITVHDFRIEDETGRLDFCSRVTMADAQGNASAPTEIRVNQPMRFGPYKVYQQTYGTAGAITVRNAAGGSDTLTLTEPAFLTLDGRTGVFFNALYPGYAEGADGGVTLITSTEGAYDDPVYDLRVMDGQGTRAVLAFPGEEIAVGDLTFVLGAPVSYPGLRIKYLPPVVMGALYASFAFIVAALYICFFVQPVRGGDAAQGAEDEEDDEEEHHERAV